MGKITKGVRGVLSLISIQSTPLTVGALLFGYATVEGTILKQEVVALAVMGAFHHWTFYSMNDVFDYGWDLGQNKTKKPLVAGYISKRQGEILALLLFVTSLLIGLVILPPLAFLLYLIAIIMGTIYNEKNKTSDYSFALLGEWGVAIVLVGGVYAGTINITTILVSLFLGAHMVWMTFEGNLKDMGYGESTLASRLGCQIKKNVSYRYMFTPIIFNVIALGLILAEAIILLLIPVSDGIHATDVIFVYTAMLVSIAIFVTHSEVMRQKPFVRSEMAKDIALHEAVTVAGLAAVSLSYAGVLSILTLGVGTIVWGTITQTILYGHPLRFP